MKRKITLRLLAAVCMLVLVPALCAAAGFSYRNGISWDTTEAGMLAAEGLGSGGNYNRKEENGYTFFYLKDANVYYVFQGDALLMAYAPLGGTYDAAAEAQTALFGAPAEVSADTVSALINRMTPGSTTPQDFTALTAWRFSDGTLAALFTLGGVSYMAYLQEARIAQSAPAGE